MKNVTKKIVTIMIIVISISSLIIPNIAYALNIEENINFAEITSVGSKLTNSISDDIIPDEKYYSTAYKEYLKLSDEEKEELNVVPNMYDVPLNIDLFNQYKTTVGNSSETAIPVSYTLTTNDVDEDGSTDINVSTYGNLKMKIKNQGSLSVCWAFASLNALETNLALNGYTDKNGNVYDYSEAYIDNLALEGIKNANGNVILKDRTIHSSGNFYHFIVSQANGYGVVLEEEVPYSNSSYNRDYLLSLIKRAEVLKDLSVPTVDKVNNRVLINNSYYTLSDDVLTYIRNEIKEHIMTNGSLYAAINSTEMVWSNGEPVSKNGYINLQNDGSKIVLNSKSTIADHAVTIIGWDDNYSKENFPASNRPSSDGAYIAMNSWGEEYLGTDNIFYISYEDYLVETSLCGVTDSAYMSPWYVKLESRPNQTQYFAGEYFNPNGMKIKACYQDETEEDITNKCTYKTTALEDGDEYIEVLYKTDISEQEYTYSIKIPITINELKKGDINRDGKITLYDAFSMLRKIISENNFTDIESRIMDYNEDKKITLYDAFSFLRQIILS